MWGEKMIKIKPSAAETLKSHQPEVEWWDAFFLPEGRTSFKDDDPSKLDSERFFMDRVTHYV